MTRVHLVRHAEKIGPDVLAGRTPGVSLTERGHAQAQRLATFLAGEPIDHVVSSPLERTRETAEAIAQVRGLAVELEPALIEMDLGTWTGRTPRELAGDAHWERYNRFRSGTLPPGGESMLAVQARIVGGLLRWREAHPDGQLVMVSHAEPIRAALLHFLGLPLDHWFRVAVDLASVSTLELSAESAQITRVNLTAPL